MSRGAHSGRVHLTWVGHGTVVVAMGGGAVIDAGKALAACLTMTRPLMDHLEVVGQGRKLPGPGAPLIAVPTTAGAGAGLLTATICEGSVTSPKNAARLACA